MPSNSQYKSKFTGAQVDQYLEWSKNGYASTDTSDGSKKLFAAKYANNIELGEASEGKTKLILKSPNGTILKELEFTTGSGAGVKSASCIIDEINNVYKMRLTMVDDSYVDCSLNPLIDYIDSHGGGGGSGGNVNYSPLVISSGVSNVTLANNTVYYKDTQTLTHLNITIPQITSVGFLSEVTFTGYTRVINIDNSANAESQKYSEIKYIQFGNVISFESFDDILSVNANISLQFYVDGLALYCYINEIQDTPLEV